VYQHVLVAIDGSSCSRSALTEAIRIALSCNSHLEILHVIDYQYLRCEPSLGVRADVGPFLIEAGKDLLRDASAAAAQAGLRHSETLIDEVRSMGDVAALVEEHVRTCGADIVVVGTHGRHGLKRLLLGSVAETLARHCPLPVLLVKCSEGPPNSGEG